MILYSVVKKRSTNIRNIKRKISHVLSFGKYEINNRVT